MTAVVECPYCNEQLEVAIDWSVTEQSYVEDCQVCCRPMELTVTVSVYDDGSYETRVNARTGDD
jgi:transcription elongation factor Elf1